MSDVDFSKFRSTLNSIFFTKDHSSPIQRDSKEYEEFWTFLEKYQMADAKKIRVQGSGDNTNSQTAQVSSKFGVPMKYDKCHRLNMRVKEYRLEDYVRHSRDDDRHRSGLTSRELQYFKFALEMFLDFLQKRRFKKLAKIRKDKEQLPIFGYRSEIVKTVSEHQVVLIAGDTGCGKSTQIPQYLSEAGYAKIAVTQPRRIACLSLASRVGYETLSQFSSKVGYQVRFEKAASKHTNIVFLTEGLLLRQMMDDPQLDRYDVIVLDEVHERHIHTDFLLGVMKCLVRVRNNVKVILMSATINLDQFSVYFNNCPMIKVPGRMYPIELEYHPIRSAEPASKSDRLDPEPYLRVMQMIDMRYPQHERGDLLVFVSGMSDIQAISEAARLYAERSRRWIVLALHSTLSVREQDKVFDVAPPGVRKCIISTNIAETSVTIDGVRFVMDSGRVKEMSFDSGAQMERLKEFWISRASAEQRKGRSGRTGPGVCFRLYSEDDYNTLKEYSTPEIQRVSLNSLVLQMISMGLPDVRKFPFIDPPDRASLDMTVEYLREQGALTIDEVLTPMGRMLAQLPVEVVIGKMLILGSIFHINESVLSLAAVLSVQSPLTNRAHTDREVCRNRRPFESEHGDPLMLLNLYHAWLEEKEDGGGGASRKWCRKCGLEEQRMYEMAKLRGLFRDLLQEQKLMRRSLKDEAEMRRQSGETMDSNAYRRDRKRLRSLQREKRSLKENKRRKILDFDTELRSAAAGDLGEDNVDDLLYNLDDLEFRLTNDPDSRGRSEDRSLTSRQIEMLKMVMCSGLYPQFAIADVNNSFRRDSEQSFHTRSKNFVLLHPNDFFASNPKLLQAKEEEKVTAKDGMSTQHSLLAFVSLMETTKPFLINTLRVPALQSLLLYAQAIDTNSDGTRLVIDDWLEIRFAIREDAEMTICSAMQLRSTLERLIKMKLKDEDGQSASATSIATLERILAFKLTDFLCSDVRYTLRRLHSADLKQLYRGCEGEDGRDDIPTNPRKGGHQLTPYLLFGCLKEESNAEQEYHRESAIRRVWTCDKCGKCAAMNDFERLQHQGQCQGDENRLMEEAEESSGKAMEKTFHCDKCEGDFQLSKADAIRHVRGCSGKRSNETGDADLQPFHCDVCRTDFRLSTDEVIRHIRDCLPQSQ